MTTIPRQTEPSANNALGGLLQAMMGRSRVRSENTRAIAGHPGLQPDILITATGRSPVVIESEFIPAANVEQEAKDRLGLETTVDGRVIEAVIAIRYPEALRRSNDLHADIKEAKLSYCVFTEETKDGVSRFPESGWLDGSAENLADMVRLVSVPQRAVNEAADTLEQGIERAAKHLDQLSKTRPGIIASIAKRLGMRNVPQTRRMACAIIANALVFHERFAGMHEQVRPLRQVCGVAVLNPVERTLEAWDDVLRINYWPIFAIAKDVLGQMDSREGAWVLRVLRDTAESVNTTGVDNAHDLTGRIFQRLIADRKYLATFYTLHASAALLARLAVTKMEGIDWGDLESIRRLKVADFACGTGALLSAVYEQIAARHERAGGDLETLHKVMMEEVLYGCDVMPSAVHITASTLAGMEPSVGFDNSRIYYLPYGRQPDGSVEIGSLELLQSSAAAPRFNTSNPAMRTDRIGEETAAYTVAEFPDEGYDLVIMNPPFTSNTKHRDAQAGVLNAAFAAFDAPKEEQAAMAHRLKVMAKGSCYHGHAGLASAFAALASKKLKPGGVVALVLPFTAINGSSWQRFRAMLAKAYSDITVLSIAANGKDMSFSSDTGMAECLVIARKRTKQESPDERGLFVSLLRRPQGFAQASSMGNSMLCNTQGRRLEDGPYGGIPIQFGDVSTGEVLNAPIDIYGKGWSVSRILDASIAQTAHALSNESLWLPGESRRIPLPMTTLNRVGQRGLDSQMFISLAHKGPFTRLPASPTATYPALWNHNAANETRIVCYPDSQLQVRSGMEDRAAVVWTTASRSHLNRDFTFGSQPLSIAFTDMESVGGRVWPNVIFSDGRFDFVFSVWGNSTLGLVSYWWHSSRQQSSKAGMTIRSAESLPVLDFRTLTDEQLIMAELIFDEFRDKELMPAFLADADPNRALLDRRVICDLLGFDKEVYEGVRRLAAKWCAEPSVHGGKKRPKGASLVI